MPPRGCTSVGNSATSLSPKKLALLCRYSDRLRCTHATKWASIVCCGNATSITGLPAISGTLSLCRPNGPHRHPLARAILTPSSLVSPNAYRLGTLMLRHCKPMTRCRVCQCGRSLGCGILGPLLSYFHRHAGTAELDGTGWPGNSDNNQVPQRWTRLLG